MKFYISTSGIKRVTISSSAAAKGYPASASPPPVRRISSRSMLPVVLLLGIVLPFVFLRIAFQVLESATNCSSTIDCIRWRLLSGSDSSLVGDELTRALLEAKEGNKVNTEKALLEAKEGNKVNTEKVMESFDDLVREMTSKRQDIKTFAFNTKAMLSRMEHKVQRARQRESIYWHLASHGVPKGLHCLCLKLAEEYAVNAMARSRLPPPEYVSRLSDPSFHHLVLLTDNVLAASVVISSTIENSINPERLVFHIVTDKKTYTPMHAWFAINSVKPAVVEVKGLHQYDWSHEVNVRVKEMLEIHHLIWNHYYANLKEEDFKYNAQNKRYLEALSPSCLSLMNHLRIYIPELFPNLNKIVFLDDDVVIQHDISPLWELDLNGKVIGAVDNSWCGDDYCCRGRKYKDYFNFSHPIISSNFDHEHCAWLYGMNVFDLEAWRSSNITETYHQWLKINLRSGLGLWYPGVLPPTLIAFKGHVHPIDPSFHVDGLGYRSPEVQKEVLEAAAAIHFSGPAKPWLEIGSPEVRGLWDRHVNSSNKFVKKCRIMG
ncbi:hypothetical protein UlMin_015046 [Ulmus minor]